MGDRAEFTAEAVAGLEALTLAIQERVLRKIKWLCDNFDEINHQSLSADLSGLFKLRIGDYRVIYSFDSEAKYITIHRIGHRRDIYD